MVSTARASISVDVVVCVGGGAGGSQTSMGMISCWQHDTKHRKHQLWSVSFANHKRLKLHMCVYSGFLKKRGGRGRWKGGRTGGSKGQREKESVLMSASLLG